MSQAALENELGRGLIDRLYRLMGTSLNRVSAWQTRSPCRSTHNSLKTMKNKKGKRLYKEARSAKSLLLAGRSSGSRSEFLNSILSFRNV